MEAKKKLPRELAALYGTSIGTQQNMQSDTRIRTRRQSMFVESKNQPKKTATPLTTGTVRKANKAISVDTPKVATQKNVSTRPLDVVKQSQIVKCATPKTGRNVVEKGETCVIEKKMVEAIIEMSEEMKKMRTELAELKQTFSVKSANFDTVGAVVSSVSKF